MADFYSIPLSFISLFEESDQNLQVSTENSLRQHISLIITTRLGDFRFDPSYGCKIWEVDFVVPSNLNTWKDEIKKSLEEAILTHEKRIEQIERFIVRVERGDPEGAKRINQQLEIELTVHVKGVKEPIDYYETLYFNPVSLV
ncbi:MAG: GPW/gp25 family protein [Bacteroidota bacterium]